jgi:hypothetical protein
VRTYKRLTNTDQKAFNDEIFDASIKFITWDLPRIAEVAKPYANQHITKLVTAEDGWMKIAKSHAPQNYGYNGIKLASFLPGTTVELDFKGIAGADGYRSINLQNAGWRYGFVAQKKDGTRVYGDVLNAKTGKANFSVPENTAYLWLVVSGAPQEHTVHIVDGKDENDEQWPYAIKLKGAVVDAMML